MQFLKFYLSAVLGIANLSTSLTIPSPASPISPNTSEHLESLTSIGTDDNKRSHALYRRDFYDDWEINKYFVDNAIQKIEERGGPPTFPPLNDFPEATMSEEGDKTAYEWTDDLECPDDVEGGVEERKVVLDSYLGGGGGGSVYSGSYYIKDAKGTWRKQGDVAVKKASLTWDGQSFDTIDTRTLAGAELQKSLNDIEDILNVEDVSWVSEQTEDGPKSYQIIVTPLVEPAVLLDDASILQLPLKEKKEFVLRLLKAAAQMHEQDVAHRDINPSNIMHPVKIFDFDMATDKYLVDNEYPGTDGYRSPEMMALEEYDPKSADIFALAITILEILYFPDNESVLRLYMELLDADKQLPLGLGPGSAQMTMEDWLKKNKIMDSKMIIEERRVLILTSSALCRQRDANDPYTKEVPSRINADTFLKRWKSEVLKL